MLHRAVAIAILATIFCLPLSNGAVSAPNSPVDGRIYWDVNGNGKHDEHDIGIASMVTFCTGDGFIGFCTGLPTLERGYFLFHDLPPLEYHVIVEPKRGCQEKTIYTIVPIDGATLSIPVNCDAAFLPIFGVD